MLKPVLQCKNPVVNVLEAVAAVDVINLLWGKMVCTPTAAIGNVNAHCVRQLPLRLRVSNVIASALAHMCGKGNAKLGSISFGLEGEVLSTLMLDTIKWHSLLGL
jgi:hypothetical protein